MAFPPLIPLPQRNSTRPVSAPNLLKVSLPYRFTSARRMPTPRCRPARVAISESVEMARLTWCSVPSPIDATKIDTSRVLTKFVDPSGKEWKSGWKVTFCVTRADSVLGAVTGCPGRSRFHGRFRSGRPCLISIATFQRFDGRALAHQLEAPGTVIAAVRRFGRLAGVICELCSNGTADPIVRSSFRTFRRSHVLGRGYSVSAGKSLESGCVSTVASGGREKRSNPALRPNSCRIFSNDSENFGN